MLRQPIHAYDIVILSITLNLSVPHRPLWPNIGYSATAPYNSTYQWQWPLSWLRSSIENLFKYDGQVCLLISVWLLCFLLLNCSYILGITAFASWFILSFSHRTWACHAPQWPTTSLYNFMGMYPYQSACPYCILYERCLQTANIGHNISLNIILESCLLSHLL